MQVTYIILFLMFILLKKEGGNEYGIRIVDEGYLYLSFRDISQNLFFECKRKREKIIIKIDLRRKEKSINNKYESNKNKMAFFKNSIKLKKANNIYRYVK